MNPEGIKGSTTLHPDHAEQIAHEHLKDIAEVNEIQNQRAALDQYEKYAGHLKNPDSLKRA